MERIRELADRPQIDAESLRFVREEQIRMRMLLERDPPKRFEFILKTTQRRIEPWQTSEIRSWMRARLPKKVSSVRTILHTRGGEHVHLLVGIATRVSDNCGLLETVRDGMFHVEPIDSLPLMANLKLFRVKDRSSLCGQAPLDKLVRVKSAYASYHAGTISFGVSNRNVIDITSPARHNQTLRARVQRVARRLLNFY